MNTTLKIEPESDRPSETDTFGNVESGHPQTLDRTLNEIRSGRRLIKLASSIESFLNSQISRLESGFEQCQAAVENDSIVRRILSDFETEKQEWQQKRLAEIHRLNEAGEQLAQGWQRLEDERRDWSDERHGR